MSISFLESPLKLKQLIIFLCISYTEDTVGSVFIQFSTDKVNKKAGN